MISQEKKIYLNYGAKKKVERGYEMIYTIDICCT